MKRAPELRGLSSDHHRALVMARKAKKAGAEGKAEETWKEMERFYDEELDDHFRIEEEYLAPGLEALGETELVARLYKEHEEIRGRFRAGAGRSSEDLVAIGRLLERHARFEERELFNVAQELLDRKALEAIEQASGGHQE